MKKKGKKSVLTYGLTAFMTALLLFASCTLNTETEKSDEAKRIDNAIDNAKKDLDVVKEEYKKRYETFKMESESKFTENKKIIADLKAGPKNKNKTVQAEIDKTLTDLEERNQALNDEINNYKEIDTNKWESFKVGFSRDMDNLGEALKDMTKKT